MATWLTLSHDRIVNTAHVILVQFAPAAGGSFQIVGQDDLITFSADDRPKVDAWLASMRDPTEGREV